MAKFVGEWALANGQVAALSYGAFGEEGGFNIGRFGFTGHFCVGADRTTPLTRRYDPRVRLPEIGLDYYGARFYDPTIGRFMTPDPAGMVDGPNLYAYVLNDPINFTDPSGLHQVCDSQGRCADSSDPFVPVPGGGFIQVGPITVSPGGSPPPFTGVAFDHSPSNENGPQNNTGRGPFTPAPTQMMMPMMMCPSMNAADRRTRLTWPDGYWVGYDYDKAGQVNRVADAGGSVLAQIAYDDLGRRAWLARSNGVVTYYGYDGGSRLASLTHRFPSRADMAKTFAYNPASQIISEVQSPAGEAYAPPEGPAQSYATNALDQYTSAAGEALSYNTNGATTARGGRTYAYDSDNRLTGSNQGGSLLSYDPAGRLQSLTANGLNTRFVYDGGQLTGEVDANGVMIRRYVPLPGPDEALAMYDSTGVSYPLADSRGTPMAWALANGQVAVQGYGAFGEEGGSNIGRFGFTGQMRLPEIGLHYYKARFYDPTIGRFMTPDPAGMVDGPNLYAYVLNDPINFTDPSGLCETRTGSRICITSQQTPNTDFGGFGGRGGGSDPCANASAEEICIPGRRIPRQPFFVLGPAFPIFVGGGRGPVVGGGPSIGDGGGDALPEMMQPEMASRETCISNAGAAGGIVGGLVGLVATGALVASAPATITGFVALTGSTLAAGAIVGTIGYFAAGDAGLLAGSQVGQLALVAGRNAILSSPRVAAAFGASVGGGQVIPLVTGAVGAIAGNLLGQRFCSIN